jgi:hypothetical protein
MEKAFEKLAKLKNYKETVYEQHESHIAFARAQENA